MALCIRKILLSGIVIFHTASSVSGQELGDIDFRGLQTRVERYKNSGEISVRYEYYPPSLLPGRTNVYALKLITTSYDVVDYKPRAPIENVYIVDCANRSVSEIISIVKVDDFRDLPPSVVSEFRRYNSNTATQVKGFDVKRVADNESVWTVSDSAALEIVCGS